MSRLETFVAHLVFKYERPYIFGNAMRNVQLADAWLQCFPVREYHKQPAVFGGRRAISAFNWPSWSCNRCLSRVRFLRFVLFVVVGRMERRRIVMKFADDVSVFFVISRNASLTSFRLRVLLGESGRWIDNAFAIWWCIWVILNEFIRAWISLIPSYVGLFAYPFNKIMERWGFCSFVEGTSASLLFSSKYDIQPINNGIECALLLYWG